METNNIGIIFNGEKFDIFLKIKNIIDVLQANNFEIYIHENYAAEFKNLKVKFKKEISQVVNSVDLILAVGGDGTIIHTAKIAAEFAAPVLGINTGNLGFLAAVEYEDFIKNGNLLNEDFTVDKRTMLEIELGGLKYLALNEIVLNRTLESQLADYKVYRENKEIYGYRSDGIIISTPTGSTAYALSSGSMIAEPNIKCFIINPICAHSLATRGIILDSAQGLSLKYIPKFGSKIAISIDGKIIECKQKEGMVRIRKSDLYAKLVSLDNNKFFENTYKKLR